MKSMIERKKNLRRMAKRHGYVIHTEPDGTFELVNANRNVLAGGTKYVEAYLKNEESATVG
jgi:hypothetical protein